MKDLKDSYSKSRRLQSNDIIKNSAQIRETWNKIKKESGVVAKLNVGQSAEVLSIRSVLLLLKTSGL